jgi:hypothetical protein
MKRKAKKKARRKPKAKARKGKVLTAKEKEELREILRESLTF